MSIMVIAPVVVICMSFWWEPDIVEPEGANEEHEEQEQGDKHRHDSILCGSLPDVALARRESGVTRGKETGLEEHLREAFW